MRLVILSAVVTFFVVIEVHCSSKKTCHGCDCSVRLKIQNRIATAYNEIPPHQFPFLVLLHDYLRICGGTLITGNHVLTSAACASQLNVHYAVAALGLHEIDKKKNIIEVQKFITNKLHKSDVNSSVALAVLKKEATYDNTVKRACLLRSEPNVHNTKRVVVVGWGEQGYRGPPRKTPLMGTLNYLGMCSKTHLCIGSGDYPCNGDQGGPILMLVDKNICTIGVQIYDIDTANELKQKTPMPAVPPALNWIKENIGNDCVCEM